MKSLIVAQKEPEEGEEPLPQWPVLQTLNLQDNSIKELGPITNCPSLRFLDLSDNSISSISEEFEGHGSLVELDLGINQLNNLAKLGGMPELKRLYLNNNRIKELAGLDGLGNLQYLGLRGNMI
jgi:Leucine-rich repeat (LRR) protein